MKRCDQRKGKGEGKVMWGDFRDQERAGGRTRGGGGSRSPPQLCFFPVRDGVDLGYVVINTHDSCSQSSMKP